MNAGLLSRLKQRAESIARKYREVAHNAASLAESERQKALQANAWRADFVTLDTDVYNELERLYTENQRLNQELDYLEHENETLQITVRQQATKLQTFAQTTQSAAQTAKSEAELAIQELEELRKKTGSSTTELLLAYPDLALKIYGKPDFLPFEL